MMVLMSHSTNHPDCPVTAEYVRVDTYLSQMVIKAHTTFEEVSGQVPGHHMIDYRKMNC